MKLKPVAWKAHNGMWACCENDADVYERRMGVNMYPIYELSAEQIKLLESQPEVEEK